jgi:hypothetical protein
MRVSAQGDSRVLVRSFIRTEDITGVCFAFSVFE